MTPKERAVMQQALEALVKCNHFHDYEDEITALREALAEQADHETVTQDEIIRMAREAGLIQYVQVEKTCVSNALERFAALVAAHEREKQAEQEPVAYLCKGTRYKVQKLVGDVMICGLPDELIGQWVALVDATDGKHIKAAAPVRTKDLTDDEIYTLYSEPCSDREMVDFARAVIAKYKEKNK